MSYLKWREIKELADEVSAGETKNFYHCKPYGDNDRLYITRENNGTTVLAYCHHCGKRGYFSEDYASAKQRLSAFTSVRSKSTTFSLPCDSTGVVENWHKVARSWWYSFGLTDIEAKQHGIVYSPYLHKLIVPVSRDGELLGYQERSLDGSKPKWKTKRKDRTVRLYYHVPTGSKRVVIVEDALSAIKVARHESSLAIFGNNMHKDILKMVVDSYDEFAIFLDDDEHQVKINQTKMKQRLDLYGLCSVLSIGKDPKRCTDKELQCLIT